LIRRAQSVSLRGVYAVWALLFVLCVALAWSLSPSTPWRALSVSVVVMFWIDVLVNIRHTFR
jgi:hypothetical protein